MQRRSTQWLASTLVGVFVLSGSVSAATATTASGDTFDRVAAKPRGMQGVEVNEQVGAQVPLELGFTDAAGKPVKLGDYFGGTAPVLLTFNYSDCPMLCNLQLGALSAALNQLNLQVGSQFQVVTVVLNPKEEPKRTADTKVHYVGQFSEEKRPGAERGWHFLRGSDANIQALAKRVGFGYRYHEARDEYVHPASMMMLNSEGRVMQYVNGIAYTPTELSNSIVNAGLSVPSQSAGFALSCFYYDSQEGSHSSAARGLMKYGGMGFAAILLFAVALGWRFSRSTRRESHRS